MIFLFLIELSKFYRGKGPLKKADSPIVGRVPKYNGDRNPCFRGSDPNLNGEPPETRPLTMQLGIHSDASYLNAPKARSRVGGFFYLGHPSNGAILTPTGILKLVASSAAEAEIGGLFTNLKEGVILRQTLTDMGHPQDSTPVQTDNSTAQGFSDDSIKQQKTRAIDMRFHWVRDRQQQKQFKIFWDKGIHNKADYFTKHHSPSHHQLVRSQYLHCFLTKLIISRLQHQPTLRGCVHPNCHVALGMRARHAPAPAVQPTTTRTSRIAHLN